MLTNGNPYPPTTRNQRPDALPVDAVLSEIADSLGYDAERWEAIERSTALVGSLRPEEIRAVRRKNLEVEKANLESLLTQIQQTKTSLDLNTQKADAMVEKLRTKLEKDIDSALDDDTGKP